MPGVSVRRDVGCLRELRTKLRDVDVLIHQTKARLEALRAQRRELLEDKTREQTRLDQNEIRARASLENQVIARLDNDMTAPDVAAAVGCSRVTVIKILREWRARQDTTLRRGGHLVAERRSTK